jgi:hypothetical protein
MEWNRTLPQEKDFCKTVLVTCKDAVMKDNNYIVIMSYINEQGKFCNTFDHEIILEAIYSWMELPVDVNLSPF